MVVILMSEPSNSSGLPTSVNISHPASLVKEARSIASIMPSGTVL